MEGKISFRTGVLIGCIKTLAFKANVSRLAKAGQRQLFLSESCFIASLHMWRWFFSPGSGKKIKISEALVSPSCIKSKWPFTTARKLPEGILCLILSNPVNERRATFYCTPAILTKCIWYFLWLLIITTLMHLFSPEHTHKMTWSLNYLILHIQIFSIIPYCQVSECLCNLKIWNSRTHFWTYIWKWIMKFQYNILTHLIK